MSSDAKPLGGHYFIFQLVCDEGYSIKYGVSNSFYCNDYADYLCKRKPIKGQYYNHLTSDSQSEASITIT